MASLAEFHKKSGNLEWSKAVDLALGFMRQATTHPSLVDAVRKNRELLERDPGGRVYLELTEYGAPYRIEPLLKLWQRLRDDPWRFYDEVAQDISKMGHFDEEDFKKYKPEVRAPHTRRIRGVAPGASSLSRVRGSAGRKTGGARKGGV
ncbi:MAG: hypothetical protein ABWK05_02320 [Pyrobaculum sp.]